MGGMTVQERIDDICKKSGMSEDIVRRVLNAEKASVIESLKRGERATIIGRCILRPQIQKKLVVGGEIVSTIKVRAEVSHGIQSELAEHEKFLGDDIEKDTSKLPDGIRVMQIQALI